MKIIVIILLTCLYSLPVYGTESDSKALDYNFQIDGALTISLFITSGLLEIFKDKTLDTNCTWCSQNSFDNGARDIFRWNNVKPAGILSNAALIMLPAVAALPYLIKKRSLISSKSDWEKFLTASLIITETFAVSIIVSQGVKWAFQRERPYVQDLPLEERDDQQENFVSFYSGHASSAFAIAVSSAYILKLQDSPYFGWALGANLLMAASVGYFRVAADRHYFTDIFGGAIAGTAIGLLIPYLHKKKKAPKSLTSFYFAPSPSGVMAGFTINLN
jgi:membrane-associated phospholipid phosphatase